MTLGDDSRDWEPRFRMSADDVTLTEAERCQMCGPGYWIGDDGCRHTGTSLADRLAQVTARAERAEAQVERVRGLVRDWTQATCIADGAPCSFHRQSPGHAADVLAALAETADSEEER